MRYKKIQPIIITFIFSIITITSICSCGSSDGNGASGASAQLNVERIERDGI